MMEPDYIEQGMKQAEKGDGFSVVRGGSMSPDSVYAQYRSLQNRAPVPYVAPEKPATIPQGEVIFTVEMKRGMIGISFATACGICLTNSTAIAATIAAAVAPVAAVGVGLVALAIVFSCLRGSGSGVQSGAKQETQTHVHYHQYNYSGSGEQKNA